MLPYRKKLHQMTQKRLFKFSLLPLYGQDTILENYRSPTSLIEILSPSTIVCNGGVFSLSFNGENTD
uniref:Uncharacterized protein n=1 Tax=Romanomermis culicivorax TaxID=13658 RepID=A0A915L8T2_ROMCU